MTQAALLEEAARRLRRGGLTQPAREAALLVGHLLGRTVTALLTSDRDPVDVETARRLDSLVERRLAGEPLQYLTGVQEFWSLAFQVDPRVLIPRPETEELVQACLDCAPEATRIADVGTGSGCVAIALARELPEATVLGLDRSGPALAVARANGRRLVPGAPVRWMEGDLLEPLAGQAPMDLLVSNPPYVTEAEHDGLQREVRDHEPRGALVAGPRGLEVLERLIDAAPRHLIPGGWLVLEMGQGQWGAVRHRLNASDHYEEPRVRRDFQGIERVAVCRTRSAAS